MDELNAEGLYVHNGYRYMHGVQDLQYNPQLAQQAQYWASKLAEEDCMYHSGTPNIGENIFSGWGNSDVSARAAIDNWYAEINQYDPNNVDHHTVGHFTQVVWAGSYQLGMGSAVSQNGTTYIVANYYPPGNFNNDYANNVFPRQY